MSAENDILYIKIFKDPYSENKNTN